MRYILAIFFAFISFRALAGDARCMAVGAEKVQVVAVNERLELLLEDDRRILLAGVEPPAGSDGAARTILANWLLGQETGMRTLANAPDRWGRIPALIFAPVDGQAGAPVADALLHAGLARIRITPLSPCLADLRVAETFARDNGEGVWAQPATAAIDASDKAAFAGLEGSGVVVEGRVIAVNTIGYRTYINFGPRRYNDFSITILKPNLKIFDKSGLSVQSLLGHRLRVRGLLDIRFGPQIEVSSPDAIELID